MKSQIVMLGIVACCAVLQACGGRDPDPPVTVAYRLTVYDESNSFVSMMRQVRQRGVVPSKLECGLLNNWKAGFEGLFIWVDGYDPRLAYLTFDAADFAAVKDMNWYAVVDEKWRNTFDDPFDCGPLPAID